jgi:membrane protein implicated in regulation of membrane protease activity
MEGVVDLGSWFAGLTLLELFYVIAAVVGGLLLLVRLAMMMVGADGGIDGMGGLDADAGLHIMSVHGMSAFSAMFGLVGLAMLRAGMSELASVAGAFVGGAVTMFAVAGLSQAMLRLQSSGNVDVADAVGAEGIVYLTIPPGGTGQAQIRVQNRLRTYDARGASDSVPIATGTRVRVVEVKGDMLVVEKA